MIHIPVGCESTMYMRPPTATKVIGSLSRVGFSQPRVSETLESHRKHVPKQEERHETLQHVSCNCSRFDDVGSFSLQWHVSGTGLVQRHGQKSLLCFRSRMYFSMRERAGIDFALLLCQKVLTGPTMIGQL